MYILNKLISHADNGSLIKTTPDSVRRGGVFLIGPRFCDVFSCKHLYFIVVTLQSPNEWCICGKFCILFRQWHEFLFFYRSLKRKKRRNQKRKKFDSSVVNWWFAVIQTTQHPTAGVHTATCLNVMKSEGTPCYTANRMGICESSKTKL